ncbi:pyridoxal phosphate-dependent aminotransferase [Pseudomonas allii]|uniref:pyridoxal phosphate-dependent aminotransferase n=1 Tax=Pseudomonas allii TaxID=2740531 RepID=UPI001F03AEDB|nr:aminotransferase class I/II-fold pyridoxal phosphate-dependent enzyme [Pseudomonas allii]
MRFSPFVERIAGQGVAAWDIHHAAFHAASQGEDIIILSVGDPDFATPSFITDAAVSALRDGDTHYTEIPGRPALREAIAARYSQTLARPLDAANVITVAGAQNALFVTSLCLLQAGDEVLVLDPMYVTYEATLKASGATLVRVPCSPESGFRVDATLLAAAVTPRTRAIFFSNPNNPTGVVLNPQELQAIAELAIAHDLWVVVDEVYESLVFDGEYHSLAALPGMAERCVVIGSLSKSHAMTGWRIGWLIATPALIAHAETLVLSMLYGLPGFVMEAATAAVLAHDEVTRGMREIYRRRRDLVVAALSACPGIQVRARKRGCSCWWTYAAPAWAPWILPGACFARPGCRCWMRRPSASPRKVSCGSRLPSAKNAWRRPASVSRSLSPSWPVSHVSPLLPGLKWRNRPKPGR